jgi:hypothetical protein
MPTHVSVVVLEAQPAWLALPRAERRRHAAAVSALLAQHSAVRTRWIDADALGRGYTDLVVCEYTDLLAYTFCWEALRDTPIFAVPYFIQRDVLFGLERGYEVYEAALESDAPLGAEVGRDG